MSGPFVMRRTLASAEERIENSASVIVNLNSKIYSDIGHYIV